MSLPLRRRKREAVDRLARNVAHEFINILSGARGYCELGKRKHPADASLARCLDAAIEATDEAAELVRRLLKSSRAELGRPEIDLGLAIEGLERAMCGGGDGSGNDRSAGRAAAAILLVVRDDDERTATGRLLRALGHDVAEALDGESAWGLLADEQVTIDVLVLEAAAPGFDGPELFRRARRKRPALGCLLLSDAAETLAPGHASEPETTTILSKPFTARRLADRISGLLEAAAGSRIDTDAIS